MRATRLIACLAVIVAAFPGAAQATCDRPLTLGWEPYAPMQIDTGGDPSGLDIDIVTAALREVGCAVTYVKLPWKRHLTEIEAGTTDLAASASFSAERSAYARFSQAYRPSRVVLLARDEDPDYGDLQSFLSQGKRLGIVNGYEYGEDAMALMASKDFKPNVRAVKDVETNLRLLQAGRIDGTIGDEFVTLESARATGVRDDLKVAGTVKEEDVFIMFSKASTSREILAAFNQGLVAIKASGAYDRILDKYLQ